MVTERISLNSISPTTIPLASFTSSQPPKASHRSPRIRDGLTIFFETWYKVYLGLLCRLHQMFFWARCPKNACFITAREQDINYGLSSNQKLFFHYPKISGTGLMPRPLQKVQSTFYPDRQSGSGLMNCSKIAQFVVFLFCMLSSNLVPFILFCILCML